MSLPAGSGPTAAGQPLPQADLHVHSEWSWDAPRGAMAATCLRAQEQGLKALAFTEHADYSALCQGARLDVEGYLEAIEDCRRRFPRLAILTGVELGEPHRHRNEVEDVLLRGRFDAVLGSVHSVPVDGADLEFSELGADPAVDAETLMRGYCQELVALIEGSVQFEILAHVEYARRFWPASWQPYRSSDYSDLIQEVLATAARKGVVLEFNTTRGGSLCPAPEVLRWWRQAGGKSVSLGSDAHDPTKVGAGFDRAAKLATQAGFEPSLARVGIWSRLAEPPL